MERVAIVGAGPAGLVAAQFLKAQGFAPVLIDAHGELGGQWNVGNPLSAVWPSMRSNTARMVTRFSDLDLPEGTAIFPRNGEMLDYLRAYADRFGLLGGARFSTRLLDLAPKGGGWRLTLEGPEGRSEERFPRVVVATGAFNRPQVPEVQGLDGFAGALGAIHASAYKDPGRFRGARVLVAGGNISALEIASDLAMLGAERVVLASRRQRWVIPRLIGGVPLESHAFTRSHALWLERASPEDWAERTRAFVLRVAGNPSWYGAMVPHEDLRRAGTVGSHHFPHLVAEDRIACRPWIDRIEGDLATFADGRTEAFDAIVLATGYRPELPFLSGELRDRLGAESGRPVLVHHTFHPAAPNLAFLGLWTQSGAFFTPIEQQARWLAYVWGGVIPMPSESEMRKALEEARAALGGPLFQHLQTIRFSRLCGTDPEGRVDPALADLLAETAVTATTCRLVGPDALPGAEAVVRDEARRFGRRDLALA
jgi:NADPH-dependent 2,4-dienoyl-CoA reductase/sulfur reductase-like enzyme